MRQKAKPTGPKDISCNLKQKPFSLDLILTFHSGRKSRFLAPLDIPDISGYQLRNGYQFVKEYSSGIPGTNEKILQIRFVSNLDICKIVIVCPGQHHVKAQVWRIENVREKQKKKPNEL